jgi:hypothetical protein
MKRSLMRILLTAALLLSLHIQASAQTSGQMIFSKDASGPITQVSLSLSLRSNSRCDETESLIPDESRLISDTFSMIVGAGGVGTFQGAVKIITPEGKLIVEGFLQGTVGLSAKRTHGKHCRVPGHLEGMLTARPGSSGNRSSLVVNFSADEIVEAASPVPVYRARFNGFITLPPPVTITTDRSSYDVNSRIIATINNNTDQNIQTEDHRSYCTILFLQQNVGNNWNTVATCLLKSPTRLVKIDARQSVSVLLPPEPATAQNEPGMYRLEFLFVFLDKNDQPVGPQIILDSQPFTVER